MKICGVGEMVSYLFWLPWGINIRKTAKTTFINSCTLPQPQKIHSVVMLELYLTGLWNMEENNKVGHTYSLWICAPCKFLSQELFPEIV